MSFLTLTFIASIVNAVLWLGFASNTQTRLMAVSLLVCSVIALASLKDGNIEGWRFWVTLIGCGIPSVLFGIFPFVKLDGNVPNSLKGFLFYASMRFTPLIPFIFLLLHFVI